ncbi:MAG: hypothetical protein QXM75_00890 [Candidatus Diapherotrites archaeon]
MLVKNEIIIFNRNLGKKPNVKEISLGPLEKALGDGEKLKALKMVFARHKVAPWYYLFKGKLFEPNYVASVLNKRNDDEVYRNTPKTKNILSSVAFSTCKPNEKVFFVHADNSGFYHLGLLALTGKDLHERSFTTKQLQNLRYFLEKERPKGAILSFVFSGKDFTFRKIDMSSIINLFDLPGLDYFKFFFVEKMRVMGHDESYDDTRKKGKYVARYNHLSQ